MAEEDTETSSFSLLPEDYIASIISLTNSPEDACRLTAVSKGFKSAAESDGLWERFLPSDYQNILSGSVSPVIYSSKKELYFRLCDSHLLLDGGSLSFWLCKRTGKKCYMFCARGLLITWGSTPGYWRWTSLPESRFSEVAELRSVCWLDIGVVIRSQMLSLETNYSAYLVYKLTDRHFGLDCSSKAEIKVVDVSSSTVIHVDGAENVYLVPPRGRPVNQTDDRVPENRTDGWMEIKLGTFFNRVVENVDIHMRLAETVNLGWKKGFIVEGIEVRPTDN